MPNINEAAACNSQRAACGEAAVKAYASVKEHNTTDYFDFASESPQERLTDLLVDLRHWARSNNLEFADADRIADSHFECELDEEAEGGDGP
jgi:hypothetical protein